MKKLLLLFLFTPVLFIGQNDKSKLVIGVNIGGHSANKNTAGLYKGDVTTYNIFTIFETPNYQTNFDNYFQYPYSVVETPLNSHYKIGLEVGVHIGQRNKNGELFIEMNFLNLEVQEYFTVAIEDPNNSNPEPTYQPLPIFGEEKRTLVNLGYSIDLYNDNDIIVGLPIFAQLTNARLQRNYIVVNGQTYNINHGQIGQTNTNPGGTGAGLGIGLTGSVKFNKKFSFMAGYYAQYSRINMNDDLKPFGLHHSVFARIMFGKNSLSKKAI